MDRRRFTKGLLTTSLAAPPVLGPVSALANPKEHSEREATLARLILQVRGRKIRPAAMIFMLNNILLGVNLQREFRVYNENRSGLGGLLGGLTRPTLVDRMEGASLIGTIHFLNSMLFVLPVLNSKQLLAMQLMIAHEQYSWEIAKQIARVTVKGMPSATDIRAASAIGELFAISNTLMLAMIYPVLGRRNWP